MQILNCVPEYYREQEEKERLSEYNNRREHLLNIRRIRKEGRLVSKVEGEGICRDCLLKAFFNKRYYCNSDKCERYDDIDATKLNSIDGGCYEDYLDISAAEQNNQEDIMPF